MSMDLWLKMRHGPRLRRSSFDTIQPPYDEILEILDHTGLQPAHMAMPRYEVAVRRYFADDPNRAEAHINRARAYIAKNPRAEFGMS